MDVTCSCITTTDPWRVVVSDPGCVAHAVAELVTGVMCDEGGA